MGRILAIDYGEKRIGLAHTDELQLIASPIATVSPNEIITYLNKYFSQENVECIVIGDPKTLDDKPALISKKIILFANKLKKLFKKPIHMVDERFTSKMAHKSLLMMRAKKNKRKNKSLVDQISAVIILQSFLNIKK
tara:strand:+ start:165 stop:575 length:411 start_codon:yes stop_codon:yes gene_type:complete